MKKLFFLFIYFLIVNNCYAYEGCDHKFFGDIPVKYKILGKAQDGSNFVDMYIFDSSNNLANGYICKYEGTNLVLKQYVRNGKINGIGQAFYMNGNIRLESEFKNGVIDGYLKYFYDNGELDKIFHYKDGIAIFAECANGYK